MGFSGLFSATFMRELSVGSPGSLKTKTLGSQGKRSITSSKDPLSGCSENNSQSNSPSAFALAFKVVAEGCALTSNPRGVQILFQAQTSGGKRVYQHKTNPTTRVLQWHRWFLLDDLKWQFHSKLRAPPDFTFELDRTTHFFRKSFADCQPETRSTKTPGVGRVYLRKGHKQQLLLLQIDSDPIVHYLKLDTLKPFAFISF